jgi:tellurite resistance protein TerC
LGETPVWLWAGFAAVVVVMLAIDLGVLQRGGRVLGWRAAAAWTAVWIAVALAFSLVVFARMGTESGMAFLTAYVIEKALSVDNIFVFVIIFSFFAVPPVYQRRVLVWGVLGALVMRGLFIAAGVTLLERFEWLMYVFGALLLVTGVRLAFGGEAEVHPDRNPLVRLFRRFMPVTSDFRGERFVVRIDRRLWATPLLLVLVVIESTDVIFALDSIPAVLAITQDPFLVYTSNVFAILGLRALYFLLADAVSRFRYLKPSLALVLSFVGLKMIAAGVVEVPVAASLGVIVGILTIGVVLSLLRAPATADHPSPGGGPAVP